MKTISGILAAVFFLGVAASAQVSFIGSPITENFDGMGVAGTTTPLNWFTGRCINTVNSVAVVVAITTTAVQAGDGSSSTVGSWNLGVSGVNPGTERALGSQAGTAAGGDLGIEVRIRNNSGVTIPTFKVRYDGEEWRVNGNATTQNLVLKYSTNGSNFVNMGSAFDFNSPVIAGTSALDGNAPANRIVGLGGNYTPAAPVGLGQVIYLRWWDTNNSGNDHVLAIDNFAFSLPSAMEIDITSPVNLQAFPEGTPITVSASTGAGITNVSFYLDGTTFIGADSTVPYSVTLAGAALGNHTLTAVGIDNSLGQSNTSMSVNFVVNPNNPPTASIANVPEGSSFQAGSFSNITATVVDPDGNATIARVDFYLDYHFRVSDTTSPYLFDYTDMHAGMHTLTAVAVDTGGMMGTSAPISITVTNPTDVTLLVTNGAFWKYLDDGSNAGTAWRTNDFNDSSWSLGQAELGYGDAPAAENRPEVTLISYGNDPNNKHVTTYFRHTFSVSNSTLFTNLILKLLRDDGGVVYLNGIEVFRSNMTNGPTVPVTFASFAGTNIVSEEAYVTTNIVNPAALFRTGPNLVAVEIHQQNLTSTDVSFDLQLFAQSGPAIAPSLSIVPDPANVRNVLISWTGAGTLQETSALVSPSSVWTDVTPAPAGTSYSVPTSAASQRFYSLRP